MSIDSSLRLRRPDGAIAFTDSGSGPVVVLVPGMGDTRDVYRELGPALVGAGYRVVATDVRGHGDSDTSFVRYGDRATAEDLLALVDQLGDPAVLVGNSFAGSAAVIAAADRPDAVRGLVLLSPFLHGTGLAVGRSASRLLYRGLFARPWGARVWAAYYRSVLNRGTQATWLDDHVRTIRAGMADPQRLAAFRRLAVALDHREVEPAVPLVHVPAFIAVGALDPDYRDPAAELRSMGEVLSADTMLVPDAAHYVHAQRPDVVEPRIVEFLEGLREGEEWRDA